MTWFKVDDSFSDHPKVEALLGGKHPEAAIALWTLAGAWCAKHLTDGSIPSAKVARLGVRKHLEAATELVRVGLWTTTETGYRFRDWVDYQPTREQVTASRQRAAERQRKHRHGSDDDDGGGGVTPPVTRDRASDKRGDTNGSHAAPTRPDPTQISSLRSEGTSTPHVRLVEPEPPDSVAEVFEHWQRVMGHPRSTLDAKRRRVIANAVKAHGVDGAKQAIDGCANTDWNMGRDPASKGRRYDGIGLIFRDADQVERFQRNAVSPPSGVRTLPTAADYAASATSDADLDAMFGDVTPEDLARIERLGGRRA